MALAAAHYRPLPPQAGMPAIAGDSWQARGLIGWWPMSGHNRVALRNVARDDTHGANTGTVEGIGEFGYARDFDTNTDRIALGSGGAGWGAYVGQQAYTVHAVVVPAAAGTRRVLLADYTAAGGGASMFLQATTGNTWQWYYNAVTPITGGSVVAGVAQWVTCVRFGYLQPAHIYVNGIQRATTSSTGIMPAGTGTKAIGAGVYTGGIHWRGLVYEVRCYNRALSEAEVWALYDPASRWDLWARGTRRLYLIPKAAAAGVSLTPASVSHAHALDALPWIAQVHQLAPPDVAHGHALDATTVTETHSLTPAEVSHGHALDAATVVQTHALAPGDVAHGHALDAGVLVQTHTLSPADAGHGHALDATTVSQAPQVSPADVAHGHALEAPAVTQTHQLSPGDVGHAQALEAAVLTVTHVLQAAGIDHAHALDATTATPTQLLIAAEIAHAHALESPGVTQTHVIVVSDVLHAHLLDAATVTGGVEVVVTPLGSVIYVHADPAVIVVAADPTTITVH